MPLQPWCGRRTDVFSASDLFVSNKIPSIFFRGESWFKSLLLEGVWSPPAGWGAAQGLSQFAQGTAGPAALGF